MQPRRQHSFQHDGDELAGFVPPHEMVASSLMDTSNANVSKHAATARSTWAAGQAASAACTSSAHACQ
jgi:uncharacterized protein YbjT (DUF2867 family)